VEAAADGAASLRICSSGRFYSEEEVEEAGVALVVIAAILAGAEAAMAEVISAALAAEAILAAAALVTAGKSMPHRGETWRTN
jgi:hypothetical protein